MIDEQTFALNDFPKYKINHRCKICNKESNTLDYEEEKSYCYCENCNIFFIKYNDTYFSGKYEYFLVNKKINMFFKIFYGIVSYFKSITFGIDTAIILIILFPFLMLYLILALIFLTLKFNIYSLLFIGVLYGILYFIKKKYKQQTNTNIFIFENRKNIIDNKVLLLTNSKEFIKKKREQYSLGYYKLQIELFNLYIKKDKLETLNINYKKDFLKLQEEAKIYILENKEYIAKPIFIQSEKIYEQIEDCLCNIKILNLKIESTKEEIQRKIDNDICYKHEIKSNMFLLEKNETESLELDEKFNYFKNNFIDRIL